MTNNGSRQSFTPWRELTDQAIPVIHFQVQLPIPLDQASASGISEELIAGLVAHTSQPCWFCWSSLGVDACALYKAKQKEVSVIRCPSKAATVQIPATKSLQKFGNLKAHIRRFHQGRVQEGIWRVLHPKRTHMKLHEEGGKKFQMWPNASSHSFSVGKLNEATRSAIRGRFPCDWCGQRDGGSKRFWRNINRDAGSCPGAPKTHPTSFPVQGMWKRKYSQKQGSP